MSELLIIAKLWPGGTKIDLGENVTGGNIPPGFHRTHTATQFVTSLDGTEQYQFLFWNTGRRLTRKRKVKWTFSQLGWSTWTATMWYGKPPGPNGSGLARVRADAFMISDDAPLSGTPIDAAASTYAAGAYLLPPSGDDHVIGTGDDGASVVAKDPFPGCGIVGPQQISVIKRPPAKGSTDYFSFGEVVFSYAVSSCDFAGWLQLVCGGEDNMTAFPETDTYTDPLSGVISSGFDRYDHVVVGPFSVLQGNSADIIAAYGIGTHYINFSPPLREWIYDVPFPPNPLKLFKDLMLQALLRLPMSTDLDLLIKDVPQMNPEELGRAMRALEITLDRGKTALSMIKTQMERGGH